jgi:predicted AlkP superfamily phosphohydrolase/phosphomutase
VKFVTAADRDAVSIWRLLSDAGRRLVVVNVPLTYPAEQVNGVMLAGFDAPSIKSSAFSQPAGLIDRLEDECGPYMLHAAVAHHANAGRVKRVVEASLTAEASRVNAMAHLLETEPWDVAMYMIKATDQVAHHVWDHDAESQEPLREVYRFADQTLARLLDIAGPDCDVVVMSDHGMGWRQPAAEYLSGILQQLGYLHRADTSGTGGRWRVFKLAKRMGPRAKGFVKRRLPGLYRRFGFQIRFGGIDWANTRAFSDNTRSCVWVNLKGRDPHGIVTPEAYAELVAELREVLSSLVDTETGEPAVAAVHTPDEIYAGPHTDEAPDLQIDWNYDRPVTGLRYDGKLGHAVSAQFSKGFMHGLSGAHRPQGVLIFRGPSFASGAQVDGAALQDLAPTILHLLEVPVPDDMDGRVLDEALAEPHASRPVVRSATHEAGPQIKQVGYSDEEAAEVEERLSALGYL